MQGEVAVTKELEQKVKALEYDVKALKSEFQRSLLDMQEQLLIHYYPSLRADDASPTEGVIQSLQQIRQKKAELSPRKG